MNPALINAVPGNLVLGTHLPRLRQAPFRREKLGEYDSAAVTWILFLFFKEAARRLVSGPPSRSAPSASCCAPALNNSLVSGSPSQAIACASGKCARTRHLWTSLIREALPSRAPYGRSPFDEDGR